MSAPSPRVALIWMPLASNHGPSLGLSLLKAALKEKNISCDIYYFSLAYAKRIGVHFYKHMIDTFYSNTDILFGEWLFSQALFQKNTQIDTQYIQNCLLNRVYSKLTPLDVAKSLLRIQCLREDVSHFIRECYQGVDWSSYDMIGFSLTFHQTNSSLALGREIKKHTPLAKIIIGGPSCFHEMGVGLLQAFPFIDYVCSGEGEEVLPSFVHALVHDGPSARTHGILSREDLSDLETEPILPMVLDMDSLPYPDYDDYFKQLEDINSIVDSRLPQYLTMETSRGCWWGERHQCTFCGFNHSSCKYRFKSPHRALEEMGYFHYHYGLPIDFADTNLDNRYLKTLLPELLHHRIKPTMFWGIRTTLTKEEIKLLAQSGVTFVLTGIESFSDTLLKMMNKGTTSLNNIQTLKWCKEFGIDSKWYIMYGLPGEDPGEYTSMMELIPLLVHLDPPSCNHLRFLRFSTYLKDPERFGLKNIVPTLPFQYIFHSIEKELQSLIAYQFQVEYEDLSPLYIHQLEEAVDDWRRRKGAVLDMICHEESIRIIDTRFKGERKEYIFHGLAKDVYVYCDRASTINVLKKDLHGRDSSSIEWILNEFVDLGLMIQRGDSYLSLAVMCNGNNYDGEIVTSSSFSL